MARAGEALVLTVRHHHRMTVAAARADMSLMVGARAAAQGASARADAEHGEQKEPQHTRHVVGQPRRNPATPRMVLDLW